MNTTSEYIAALIGYSLPFALIGYGVPAFFRRTAPLAILAGAIGGSALPILSGISKDSFRLDVILLCALLGILSGFIWSLPWKKIFTSERVYQHKEGDVPREMGQTKWQDHFSDNEERLVKNNSKLPPLANTPSNQLQRQPYSPVRMAPRKIGNAPKDISGSRDRDLKSPQRDHQRYGVDPEEKATSRRTIAIIAIVVAILFAGAALAFSFLQPYSSIEKTTGTTSSRESITRGVVARVSPDRIIELGNNESIGTVVQEENLGGTTITLTSTCLGSMYSCLLIQGTLTENMQYVCGDKFTAAAEKGSGNINILVRDDCDFAGQMINFFYYRPKTKSIEYAGIEGNLEGAIVSVDNSGAISVLMDGFDGGYKRLFRAHLGEITQTEVPQDAGASDSWACLHAYEVLDYCASLKSEGCSGEISRNFPPVIYREMNKYLSAYFFKRVEFEKACRDSCSGGAVSMDVKSFSKSVCNPVFPWSAR